MKIKKIVSFLLAAIMLVSVVSVSAFAVDTVSVYFSLSGSENVVQKHKINVAAGTAKKYGYKVADVDHNKVKVNGVTVFDAIVAAHEEIYGEAFNEETKENYLVMDSSFIRKSFGKATSSTGFVVNGIMPNDGILNPKYGSYTSYTCDTATIKDGDDICYFFYKDAKYYSDIYSWFDSDSYEVKVGEEVTVNLSGYTAMYYGVNDWKTIEENYAIPLDGADVYTYSNGEEVLLGKTDKDGNLTFSFDKAGEYVLSSGGNAIDDFEEECPVITSYAKVKVVAENEEPTKDSSLKETIMDIFRSVIDFFKLIFNLIFGK